MTNTPAANRTDRRIEQAFQWWHSNLAERQPRPGEADPVDRASRARLRRCRTPMDALRVPLALNLLRIMEPARFTNDFAVDRSLGLAIVLANVEGHADHQWIMRQLGWPSFPSAGKSGEPGAASDRPRLSEARFRRLIESERRELPMAFVRLLRLLPRSDERGRRIDVNDLIRAFLYWDDDEHFRPTSSGGSRARDVRQTWTYRYYGIQPGGSESPAPPPSGDTATPTNAGPAGANP